MMVIMMIIVMMIMVIMTRIMIIMMIYLFINETDYYVQSDESIFMIQHCINVDRKRRCQDS